MKNLKEVERKQHEEVHAQAFNKEKVHHIWFDDESILTVVHLFRKNVVIQGVSICSPADYTNSRFDRREGRVKARGRALKYANGQTKELKGLLNEAVAYLKTHGMPDKACFVNNHNPTNWIDELYENRRSDEVKILERII